MIRRADCVLCMVALLAVACAGGTTKQSTTPAAKTTPEAATKEAPPAPAPGKDIEFPTVVREVMANGLELNVITQTQLPLVYMRLVARSGAETDPRNEPGLSSLTALMMREGTKTRTSAQLAEEIDFLGAGVWTQGDEEKTTVGAHSLAEHFETTLELLADVALHPAFRDDELVKLKKREKDRLALEERDPRTVARRTFYKEIYGQHPYAVTDTTPEALDRITRADLVKWHKKHLTPENAFLIVAGDVDVARVKQAVERMFGGWSGKAPRPVRYAKPPQRTKREVLIVDRPGSVQSVIYIGNLATKRTDPSWVPLMVANQVLGGSAASRLFMDLREKRSLTYGAYSGISERLDRGVFSAYASVRTEVTVDAVDAFFEHLRAIVSQPVNAAELANAKRYLSDSFPLRIDTPGKIVELEADLRAFDLPDDYWDRFRSSIEEVTAAAALEAARSQIHPERMLVVIVGQAADFAEALRKYGAVTVVAPDGEIKAQFGPRADESAVR